MSDANDFFSTTEVSARLDLVRHLIENSELVPLVRGPSGIGKTLLASRLQQLAPENWSVCHFEADPTMQPERLLATIARCCGLPDIAGELLQRLVDRFEVLRKRGRIPVLLVDDVQLLPPTSLITLLRLFERQLNGVRLVSIVLLADEQIDLLLSTPQLQVMSPQTIQVIDLPAMTRQEAAAYMRFLLVNEGLSERLALDDVKLNRLYRETKGVPGPLAESILNAVGEGGVEEKADSLLTGYKKQLLIGGVPLLLVMLLFMWMISSLIEPEPAALPDKQVERVIEPLPAPAAHSQSETPKPDLSRADIPVKPLTIEADDPGLEGETQAHEAPVSDITEITIESTEEFTETAVETESPTEPEVTEAVSSSDIRDGIKEEETSAGVGAKDETAADAEQQLEPDPGVPASEVVERPKDEEVPPVAAVSEVADIQDSAELTESVETAKPQEERVEDAATQWVMTRSPGHYTLQLIAVENLESMNRYIASNGLMDETHTFRMIRNGKPWYALLWGDFPDRIRAQQAASRLPANVQKAGVWARTFASLQQSQR